MTRHLLATMALLCALMALGGVARAQQGNTTTLTASGAPTGTCAFVLMYVNSANGDFYDCPAGSWVLVASGGGGSPSFSAITAGTNVAALLLGNGSTLGLTGTGKLNITTLTDGNGNPFLTSSATASAVDAITITTAAAANPATVAVGSTGSDSNIHLSLVPKGTGAVLIPPGTAANPSLASSTNTTTGLFISTSVGVVMSQAGTAFTCLGCSVDPGGTNRGGLNSGAAAVIGWASTGDPTVASDTMIGRGGGANILGIGGNNASTINNQLLRAVSARAGTDADHAAGILTVSSGIATGAATPAVLYIDGSAFGTGSSSSAQTQLHRHVFEGSAALTTGAAKTIASITLTTLKNTGGHIWYHAEASDGTAQCSTDGDIAFAGENSAGVFVTNVSTIGDAATACTTGKTLTLSWAMTGASPSLVQVTPTLTGITATSFRLVYEGAFFGSTAVTFTNDGT